MASAGQFDGQGDHHTPKPYVRQAFRKYLECGIFAKRLRYFMQRDGAVLNMVLRIFLRVSAFWRWIGQARPYAGAARVSTWIEGSSKGRYLAPCG